MIAAIDAPPTVETAIEQAVRRIAPLWPLKHFVAVNPFWGLADQTFEATCATLHRVARVGMLMPRAYYRDAIQRGDLIDADLEAARAEAPSDWLVPASLAAFKDALAREPGVPRRHPAHVPTVAETLEDISHDAPAASATRFMIDEISKFCAAYFDETQSVWRLPGRSLPLYTAWRSVVRCDRNPELFGIRGFRSLIASLPLDPLAAIAEVVRRQGVPDRALTDYFHHVLLDIGGWAAHARYRLWNAELAGGSDDTLVQLLAVRVAWGYSLFAQHENDAFVATWKAAMQRAAMPARDERLGDDPDLCVNLIAQDALERAYRRRLFGALHAHAHEAPASTTRPQVQAAFCIDVRSEVMRRALEAEYGECTTIGFAGFFGFPIEYVPIGKASGGAQCPVLLRPAVTVCEAIVGGSAGEEEAALERRVLHRRTAKAWKSFKTAAISSFVFVETSGLAFVAKIIGDTFGWTRPVTDPDTDGLDARVLHRLGPRIAPGVLDGRPTGFTANARVDMAEAVLRGMSLTSGFAPLVLLVGHGSTTVNNAYASGLDCGACGGYTGEANARVAAAVLNHDDVRAALRARGIAIPDDTIFVACLHDTTTDEVRVFDAEPAPATHAPIVERIRGALVRASACVRRERAPKLGIRSENDVDQRVVARSRDWSQVRPEWGLAGNAAFIAAPRHRTSPVDLGGRVFLHEYDWRGDTGFGVLELIMTAPLVVASWINLQYYGSTVNNRVFGSGNKTLHNITGAMGVLEGHAGDLRTGLPWQSVHDGSQFVHEPLRLTVVIEAPPSAIDAVVAKHETVRQLLAHRWLHLFAMDDAGRVAHQWHGDGDWTPVL